MAVRLDAWMSELMDERAFGPERWMEVLSSEKWILLGFVQLQPDAFGKKCGLGFEFARDQTKEG